MAQITKIIFLEDHTSVRESVAYSLEKLDPSLKIIQVVNVDDGIEKLEGDPEIKTAIIDLSLASTIQSGMNMTEKNGGGGGMTDLTRWLGSGKCDLS